MTIFEAVKSTVTPRMAAEHFGLNIGRNGMACCPFHNDRHPSLFVADDHYHCFACGEHGDVIDFVAKLLGLSPYDAAKKLAYDFGIQTDKPPTKAIPGVEVMRTKLKKFDKTYKELTEENAELEKKLSTTSKESVRKKLEISQKLNELDELRRTVDAIPR